MVNHQILTQKCAGILLIMIVFMMTRGTCGRQDGGAFVAQEVPQVLVKDLMAAGSENDEALYSEWKKFHQLRIPSDYNSKWPGLRDLLQTSDYDNSLDSNENANERFIDRLRQLAVSSVDLEKAEEVEAAALEGALKMRAKDTVMPMLIKKLPSGGLSGPKGNTKDRATKKNVQFRQYYMSPCHFKICNMGRKRNAQFMSYYY